MYCLSKKIIKTLPKKGTVRPCREFIQDGPNGRGKILPLIISKCGRRAIIYGIIRDKSSE